MTFEQLKETTEVKSLVESLTKGGFEFEINEMETGEMEIGIQTYKHIWSWWIVCSLNDEVIEFFRGSYSRNTGKTKKGVRRQRKVVTELHRQLGWKSNGFELFENLK